MPSSRPRGDGGRLRVCGTGGQQDQRQPPRHNTPRRETHVTTSGGHGADGIRTHDPLVANQVLSQLSYRPRTVSKIAKGPQAHPVLLRPRDRPVPLPLGTGGIRRAALLGETTEETHLVAMHARSLGALLTSVAVACHGGPRPLRPRP